MTSHILLIFHLAAVFWVLIAGYYGHDGKKVEKQAIEGALGLLECPVFEYGSQQVVTWTKRGVDVSKLDTRFSVNQRSGALRIHRASFFDSGNYTCTVIGRDNHTESRETALNVVSYPKITLTNNITVPRNTTASLECKVESVPASLVTWKRHPSDLPQGVSADSGTIPGTSPFSQMSGGTPFVTLSQLVFSSVQPHHAGLYLCLGSNVPGTASATLSLRVMYAPIAGVSKRTVIAWPGDDPDLHMTFKADPGPKVTCSHAPLYEVEVAPLRLRPLEEVNGTESNIVMEDLEPEEASRPWKVIERTEGEITYITIKVSSAYLLSRHVGTYSCTAENSAGEATGTIELLEGRVPQPPEVSIDIQTPTWMVLRLRMPADMGLPPADRIIACYNDTSETNSEPVEFDEAVTVFSSNLTEQWTLTGFKPGHEYRVSLHLENPVVRSNYTILLIKMPLNAPPEAVTFTSDAQGSNPRLYVLSWIPPTTHGSPLTSYTLTYVPVRVVHGPRGPLIVELAGPEHRVKVQSDSKSIVISGLQADTYYKATMQAHSQVGDSLLSTFLFTTSNDSEAEGHYSHGGNHGGSVHLSKLRQPHQPHVQQPDSAPDVEPSVGGSTAATLLARSPVITSLLLMTSLVTSLLLTSWLSSPNSSSSSVLTQALLYVDGFICLWSHRHHSVRLCEPIQSPAVLVVTLVNRPDGGDALVTG